MSEEKPEFEAQTLGSVWWPAFATDQGYNPKAWPTLDADYRAGIEAGCAAVAAHVVNPTADDYDRAADEIAAVRFALVEQMGHRSTVATVREVTFCGKPMLEMTELGNGGVHLVSPDSLYEVTWLTEAEARARIKPWTAVAIGAANPNPWGDDEDDAWQHDETRLAAGIDQDEREVRVDAAGNEL